MNPSRRSPRQGSDLLSRLDKYLLTHFRPLKDARLIAAYSGGSDSSVLVHLLSQLRYRRKFELLAVWIDHGIRPAQERQAESQLVEENCRQWGVELRTGRLEETDRRLFQDQGPESMARHGRLRILTEVAQDWKAWGILTAHNLDDQAETVVMRMLKGHSYMGLGGIPRQRGLFHRPLLDVPKTDLRTYRENNHLSWWEDSTNAQGDYERNRFRLEAVPVLDRLYPSWRDAVGGWGAHRAREVQELRASVRDFLPGPDRTGFIPSAVWNSWEREARIFWLGVFLQTEPGKRVPRGKLEQALRDLEGGAPVFAPGFHQVEILSGDLGVHFGPSVEVKGDISVAKSLDIGYFKTITLETNQTFLGRNLMLGRTVGGIPIPSSREGSSYFLISRSWAEGYEFPQGSVGLKKLFQSWGVPELRRGEIPLVVSDFRVLAVLGSYFGYEDWHSPLLEGERPVYLHVR